MQNIYAIEGMTCNGCRAEVESRLNQIDHIQNAQVSLEKGEVVIDAESPISMTELQNSLPAKYVISQKNVVSTTTKVESPSSELHQLFPLFLIFGYIIGASILMNYNAQGLNGFMLDFMGLFYIVFSFFKFLDLKGFPDSFRMYDPIAKKIPLYGWIYPFIELTLGLLFLMRLQILIALIITLVILGVTTIGVAKVLLDKKSIQCACLGTALKLPMTKATLIENSVMLVMAIIMLLNII